MSKRWRSAKAFIDARQLKRLAKLYSKSDYGAYLEQLLEERC
jgi:hypothetical protein